MLAHGMQRQQLAALQDPAGGESTRSPGTPREEARAAHETDLQEKRVRGPVRTLRRCSADGVVPSPRSGSARAAEADATMSVALTSVGRLDCILPKQTIQRLLSLHSMWNPNWDAYATISDETQ
jgi:hypothetical protein